MTRRQKKRREVAKDLASEVRGEAAETAIWLVLQRSAKLVGRGLGRLLDAV